MQIDFGEGLFLHLVVSSWSLCRILIAIISDLFRDHETSGVVKAVSALLGILPSVLGEAFRT